MIVVQGGLAAFNGLAYGEQSQQALNYFQNQLSNVPQLMGDFGARFQESMRNLYEQYSSNAVVQAARLAIHHAAAVIQTDTIRNLFETPDFQAALSVMQRYVMAEPTIRQAYHQQRCDGYSDTYVDHHPGKVGEAHYDWRRVMDGLIVEDEETGEWKASIFIEDLEPQDERKLQIHEQHSILNTWAIGRALFKSGVDVTNPYGGKL